LYTLSEDRWEAKPDGLLPGLDIDRTGDWSLEVLNAIDGASFATTAITGDLCSMEKLSLDVVVGELPPDPDLPTVQTGSKLAQ
jgi:hypothetical protein